MYLLENPVLQRELLVNLRRPRAFVLLFAYVALLGAVVLIAWPAGRLDLSGGPSVEAERLVGLFFLGQYALMSLMAPSFAAGAITGEKERQTYEMLLASPMRPQAIVMGKLLAALCHLGIMVFASLPIVMLCLPLGGISLYEVAATYIAMAASAMAFGMISIALSAFFTRTLASLVVSYLIILPLVLLGILFYQGLTTAAAFRLILLTGFYPAGCLVVCFLLLQTVSRRLLYPPDVGAEAKEVVDPDQEQENAVGLVIRSDQFPDRLFAPAKRTSFMADGLNPVYDKEMRSELFGQGTLMLRLVIQLSIILALPLMMFFCYIYVQWIPLYVCYVVLFNILVGPVFSAGSVTNERERQTLELLLTTTLSPWQILWGKMFSSLRVSLVLTAFVAWPLLLACVLPPWTYRNDMLTMLGFLAIIALSSLTTTTLAMFCSVLFRRTVTAMITSYLFLLLFYALPLAAYWIFKILPGQQAAAELVGRLTFTSPFAAAFSLPLSLGQQPGAVLADAVFPDSWPLFFGYLAFYGVLNLGLLLSIAELFNARWRVSGK
ncbi:MAG: ABC transporter permease subunit [Pirellulales bacterium]|nr:ABC transporter permease subunit [Pirellulales bacterium]